jgi:hypothetical protein
MFRGAKAMGAAQLCLLAGVSSALLGGACKSEKRHSRSPPASAPPSTESDAPDPARGKAAAAAAVDGRDVELKSTDPGLVISSKDAKNTMRLDTTSGKVPDDWPKDIPMYPGSKIDMSMKLGAGYTLTQETLDPPAKVAEFYKAQLGKMQSRSSVDIGKNQTLQWSDDRQPLQVTLALSAGEGSKPTRATLILTRDRTPPSAGNGSSH